MLVAYNIATSSEQEFPSGVLYDATTFLIDPETILASIDRGKKDVFTPAPSDSVIYRSPWLSDSFLWDQKDYLKIADALHQFVWKEPLDGWNLSSFRFRIFKCHNNLSGFDQADFLFYKRENDTYIVHEVLITPSEGEVQAGGAYYNYTGKWKTIDLEAAEISTASDALLLAEENDGREARLTFANDCSIYIYLEPYAFEYDFPLRLFNRRDWGWYVGYYSGNIDNFKIVIDPNTGQHKIQP